jgi:hypothetical protein
MIIILCSEARGRDRRFQSLEVRPVKVKVKVKGYYDEISPAQDPGKEE